MTDIVTTPNGLTTIPSESATPMTANPPGESASRRLLEYVPGGTAAHQPVVRLDLGVDLVVLSREDNGMVLACRGDALVTYSGELFAAPITDQEQRIALLTRALTVLNGDRVEATTALRDAQQRHREVMADVRAYIIGRHERNDISRDVLDAALVRFGLDPYCPQFKVAYTITGFYTVAADDASTARADAESQLAPNLDGIEDIASDSADYTVSVGDVDLT